MPYFKIFAFTLFSVFSLYGQITKYPLLEHSTADHVVVKEVNILSKTSSKDFTIVSFEYAPVKDEFFMIPAGMYMTDENRRVYKIICYYDKSYLLDDWYPVKAGELYEFSLIFEGVEDCVSMLSIFEPKFPNSVPWTWKNIRVKNNCGNTVVAQSQYIPIEETRPAPKKPKQVIGY
jgi:hypothetical protein